MPPARMRHVMVTLVVLTVASKVLYDLLMGAGLGQSAALFVGLPAILALIVSLASSGQGCTAQSIHATVFLLLLSWIVFGEGFICVLIASPLFFLVAIVTGVLLDAIRASPEEVDNPRMMVLLLPLALMSLEGVVPGTGTSHHTVEVTQSVSRSVDDVEQVVAGPLLTEAELPAFLRLGFPQPISSEGSGRGAGDLRRLTFGSGETVFRVAESGNGWTRFELVSDTSPIAGWLDWHSATVSWEADGNDTVVTWSAEYERLLSPAWYFVPLERYAVGLVGDYVVASIADG